ncbi:type VI secretion system Vgr family protein [Massilia sp. S19_KUP03_FR1]|uniref:type VI secretion system Vgr family protein n=1 Tax=Massilia sp. S19_KUP03_FR1 TaxID=3025503 RepID=UPI002FCDC98F
MSLSALFSSYTQSTRLLRLTTPLGAHTLLAESVHGEEGLGSGFRFTITALSLDAHLSLRDLIGQPALLELLTSDNSCRPFHGHLTMVEQSGANAGLARYTLTLEPWTAFLARNRDSRVFQYKTVREILDAVFNGWRAQGKLTPSWRYDLLDAYPQRSLSTQYQESDWAFAERLMSEVGLFYWFEHTRERHRLVIADHNGAFKPNRQPTVRFTQSGAVMREDSIDRWRCTARLLTNAVQLTSWDYRTHSSREVGASLYPATPEMICRDAPGQYAYPDQEQGQRAAERQLDAIGTRRTTFTGAGTVRLCAPGTTFTLDGHPGMTTPSSSRGWCMPCATTSMPRSRRGSPNASGRSMRRPFTATASRRLPPRCATGPVVCCSRDRRYAASKRQSWSARRTRWCTPTATTA